MTAVWSSKAMGLSLPRSPQGSKQWWGKLSPGAWGHFQGAEPQDINFQEDFMSHKVYPTCPTDEENQTELGFPPDHTGNGHLQESSLHLTWSPGVRSGLLPALLVGRHSEPHRAYLSRGFTAC